MTWPPQSPDNPIDIVWDELDRRVNEKQPTSAQHMWELLQDCWKSIPGDISYASGTYRLFKLPKKLEMSSAIVTFKGTVSDYPCQLEFESSHCFKKNAAGRRGDGCYFPVLSLLPRLLHPEGSYHFTKYGHLSPFLLADKLGSSVNQCSKTGKAPVACGDT